MSASRKNNEPIFHVDETTPLLTTSSNSEHESDSGGELEEHVSKVIIWMVFPILLCGIFLSNLVSSVVIATNQQIASEFSALSSAAWLLTAYALAQSASQPLYGKVSDIYGRRSCIIFSWVIFGFGCLIVGFGHSYWHVILGRAISGVGSAGKIALTSIIVADLVPLREVAHYRAYVNLTATVARSLGGPIGGWVAGSIGWRWCFLIQLPVSLIGLSLVIWKLPNPKQKCVSQLDENGQKIPPLSRVDFVGALSLVLTISSGLLTLEAFTESYSHWVSLTLLASFSFFLILFVVVEKFSAKEPIMPLELLCNLDVLTSYGVASFQTAAQIGLLYSIPVYYQVVGRESVSSTGTRIVPVVIGNAIGTILSGKIIGTTKKYKALTLTGNIVGIVGFAALSFYWHGSTSWTKGLLVALPGMGMGIIQSTTFIHLAACLEHSKISIAGATWFLAQNIGMLVGAGSSTTLINHVVQARLEHSLDGFEEKSELIRNITSNTEYIRTLPEEIWSLVTKAYISALFDSNILSVCLVSIALVITLQMKERLLQGKR